MDLWPLVMETGIGMRMCERGIPGTEVHDGGTKGCLEDWVKVRKPD